MSNAFKTYLALIYVGPRVSMDMTNRAMATYVQMVFALKDKNVGFIAGIFTSLLFSAIRHLERDWDKMVGDIARGSLNPDLNLDDDIREKLEKLMEPDQKRAAELKREFEKGFQGILKRIWPHLCYIQGPDPTGYGDILKEGYAKGTYVTVWV
jgi:hypothetical protein